MYRAAKDSDLYCMNNFECMKGSKDQGKTQPAESKNNLTHSKKWSRNVSLEPKPVVQTVTSQYESPNTKYRAEVPTPSSQSESRNTGDDISQLQNNVHEFCSGSAFIKHDKIMLIKDNWDRYYSIIQARDAILQLQIKEPNTGI